VTDRPKAAPSEHTETFRAALHQALRASNELGVRELSQAIGATERDVLMHLEHLERSLSHHGERLLVTPACCLACGFRFDERARMQKTKKPSRCPSCRSTRIAPPRFSIVEH
jgi:predicted Zn-ribbon and HTH transcriptional regulator